jgi:hypothetical protein
LLGFFPVYHVQRFSRWRDRFYLQRTSRIAPIHSPNAGENAWSAAALASAVIATALR